MSGRAATPPRAVTPASPRPVRAAKAGGGGCCSAPKPTAVPVPNVEPPPPISGDDDTAAAVVPGKMHKARTRKVAKLRAELGALRLSELRKRAVSTGVDAKLVDAAVDSDDAKDQLIALVVGAPPTAPPAGNEDGGALKSELTALRLTAIHKRALQEGVDSQKIDDALDSENAKQALIVILLEAAAQCSPGTAASSGSNAETLRKQAFLTATLKGQRVSALQKRAEQDGVDAAKLDEALESDNTRNELIRLIVEMSLAEDENAKADDVAAGNLHAPLRLELNALKIGALTRRAMEEGIDPAALERAQDDAKPKEAMIALLCAHISSRGQLGGCLETVDRPNPLREKLLALNLSALLARVAELGIDPEVVEEALDSADTKAALCALVEADSTSQKAANTDDEEEMVKLRQLKLSELIKRASESGVAADELERAQDADDPKEALAKMCVTVAGAVAAKQKAEEVVLRAELEQLKLSALSKRAVGRGIDPDLIAVAQDADVPREALIALLVDAHFSGHHKTTDGTATTAAPEPPKKTKIPLEECDTETVRTLLASREAIAPLIAFDIVMNREPILGAWEVTADGGSVGSRRWYEGKPTGAFAGAKFEEICIKRSQFGHSYEFQLPTFGTANYPFPMKIECHLCHNDIRLCVSEQFSDKAD